MDNEWACRVCGKSGPPLPGIWCVKCPFCGEFEFAPQKLWAEMAKKGEHIYQGDCPDINQPEASDPQCPACIDLVEKVNRIAALEEMLQKLIDRFDWPGHDFETVGLLAAAEHLLSKEVKPPAGPPPGYTGKCPDILKGWGVICCVDDECSDKEPCCECCGCGTGAACMIWPTRKKEN